MSIGPQHNGGILGATNNPTSTSAGGIWTPVQHYQAQRDGLWPVATAPLPDYTISRSLRFNKTDSAALNYTPAIAGNRKTWILSTWVKSPGTFMTNDNPIFAVRPGATPYTLVTLRASNAGTAPSALLIEDNASGMVLSTAMVFRDYSAWYHIVVAVDTTQSVSTNRVKMFVNGVQITTFAGYTTYPNQNIDTQINSTNTHYIGRDPYDANNWYSGYLADFRFIDGYPSGIDGTSWNNAGSIINLFGETDLTTGVWKPKAYSGSYGTNGFYLPFTDNSTQNNLGVNTAQVGDELRNYTVLHLSGNPANTSGYNCFSDRSSNNHLLTASGDIPTSARSPFIDTTSGSAYFSNGSYLQIPASSALTLGTADYTVEGWFYFSNFNNQHLIGNISTGSDTSWAFYVQASGLYFSNWGTTAVSYATSNLSTNTWYHLAVSRNNSLVKLFVNGNVVNSNTPANQNYSSTQTVYIGDDVAYTTTGAFTGYMSNLRVIKNQSILNNTFTPSSSPLTSTAVGHTGTGAASSITGTVSLLTLVDKVGANNSGFIDESTNNAVITRSGNVTQGSFSPFGTSGWSYYFNGTGSSGPGVMTPQNSTFNLSTGDWTIEGWYYNTQDLSNSSRYMGAVPASGATYGVIPGNSGNFSLNNFGSPNVITTNIAPKLNNWQHVALVKSGSTTYLYIDGVLGGSAVVSWPNSNSYIFFGGMTGTYAWSFSGYISNFRVVKGTAIYTSNFTPSTLPLTAVAGTAFLTAQDNRLIDNSANNYTLSLKDSTGPQVQPLSPFQPHTSVTKTYSTYLNGSSSLTPNSGGMLALGTNPYTIEFFVYITTHSDGHALAANDQDGLVVVINSTKTSLNKYNVGDVVATNAGLSTNVWHHIAIVRTSTAANQTILYIDGSQAAVGTDSNNWTVTTNPRIGGNVAGQRITGYISNLRIVSSALYSGTNITVPTAPFSSSQTGTLFLACQSNTLVDSTNSYTIASVTGNPLVTEFNPLGRTFTTGVNYSPTTHGSSAYFDGSGDYLTVPTNTNIQLSTNDFTIEFWAWLEPYVANSSSSYWASIIDIGVGVSDSNSVTGTLGIWQGDGTGTSSVAGEYCVIISGSTANQQRLHSGITGYRQWTHVALTRNSGTFNLWQNGILRQSATLSANINRNDYQVIGKSINSNIKGTISGLRVINGTALYKSNFVPQLQPPQAVANTQLLLNFNNAGVVDYTGKGVLETVGDSRSVTNNKKTLLDATGSVYFDGTNDYLRSSLPASYWNLSGDFTVEFWINPIGNSQSGSVYYDIIGTSNNQAYIGSGQTGWVIAWSAVYGLRFGWQNSNTWSIDQSLHSTTPTFNTWAHIAVVRRGSTITGYINGIAGSTPITSSTNFTSSLYSLHIGSGAGNQNFTVNGYLQDVRITTIARYTGTFTPPIRTFSATVRDVGHKQWVVNNLSVASGAGNDSLVDSPTNYGTDTGLGGEVRGNYCTWNTLAKGTSGTGLVLSNGNLDGVTPANGILSVLGTIGVSSGKWYWEITPTAEGAQAMPGVSLQSTNLNTYPGGTGGQSWSYYGVDGTKYFNNTGSAYGPTFTNNDVIGLALDMDNGTLTYYKNGVSLGVAFTGLTGVMHPSMGDGGTIPAVGWNSNFGQRPFAYTAPSGYKALCTQNLPAPSIVKPNTAFDTLAYAGNDSQTISGLNFSPDLVWVKSRSNATYNHQVHDSVRGPTAGMLSTNSNAAENNTYQFASFNSNGFTTASGNIAGINNSGNTFVAWAWDAGTSTVTNTAGNVTSQVRANPTAGISIVTYTGSNTTNGTVGHGLGVAPSFIILKNRSTDGWFVGHSSLGWLGNLRLEAQATFYNDSSNAPWGDTAPTSTVFTVSIGGGGWANASGNNYVAYCFAPISGFSAFGSYTGNGSTDGPFVYTGFKPRWVMIKRSDGAYSWWINDGARNPYNVVGQDLAANEITAESNDAPVQDFLSNGFKLRTSIYPGFNASGGNYVYAAFAENPFKYSLAR